MSSSRTDLNGFRRETLAAIEAVEQALDLTRQGVGATDTTAKTGRDLVTATDVAVEDSVRKLLLDALGIAVVGEERGGTAPTDGTAYWLVDPICGTRNYASGTPLYCVNLALVERSEVTLAIVGDPSTGEVVVAERGGGCWATKQGVTRHLATSDESRTIVVEEGKSKRARRAHAARFMAGAVEADRWDFRSLGTTLALPYVAAARISAYVVFWVTAIHAAAGSLLVTEARGMVSDISGGPWTLDSDSIIASAGPEVHAELLALAAKTATPSS